MRMYRFGFLDFEEYFLSGSQKQWELIQKLDGLRDLSDSELDLVRDLLAGSFKQGWFAGAKMHPNRKNKDLWKTYLAGKKKEY